MNVMAANIPDVLIIVPHIYRDDRGYFFETFNIEKLEKHIGKFNVIQENQSKSYRGVVRGLHFQKPPYNQAKIVSVVKGMVLDVVVDIRADSSTFGEWTSVILDGTNKLSLFIPRGFAHGFVTLSKDAIFQYKVDNYYAPNHEAGIKFDDKVLNIDWKMKARLMVSQKDKILPIFNQCEFYKKGEYHENPK